MRTNAVAAAGSRADVERPTHSLCQLAGDVETEAGAARRAGQLRIAAIELLEDSLLLFAAGFLCPRRARRSVGVSAGATVTVTGGRPYLKALSTRLTRICWIRSRSPSTYGSPGAVISTFGCARQLERPSHELGDVDLLLRDGHLTVVEPGRQQEVVDNLIEPLRLPGDELEKATALLGTQLDVGAEQRLGRAVHARHRCPQLVRDRRNEIALLLIELPLTRQVAERIDDALRALDRDKRKPQFAVLDRHRQRRRARCADVTRDRYGCDSGLPRAEHFGGMPPAQL